MLRMLAVGVAMLLAFGTADAQQSRDREALQRQQGAGDDAGAFLDARIAAMHAGLRLSAEQERAWSSFEEAFREEAKQRLERRLAGEQHPQIEDPVVRMQRRADALSQSGATLRKLADAAAPLWRSFDEAQKRRFVALARPTGISPEWRFGEQSNERTGSVGDDADRSGADRGPPRRDAERRIAPRDAPDSDDYGRTPGRIAPEEYGYGRQRRGMAPDEFRGGDRDADEYRYGRQRHGTDERGGYGGRDGYGYGRERRGMAPDESQGSDRDAGDTRGGRGMRRDDFTGRSMDRDADGARDGRSRPFMGPDEPAPSMRRDRDFGRDEGRGHFWWWHRRGDIDDGLPRLTRRGAAEPA